MDYYIVRIYRRDERKIRSMAGLVETVGVAGAKPFTSQEELLSILCERDVQHAKQQRRCKKAEQDGSEAS
jgi:hypothetical protein